jgi:MFS family permease
MLRDPQVIRYGLIVGIYNGIIFSYYTEGPFYFIRTLGLSTTAYGRTFIALALMGVCGGYISRRLHRRMPAFDVLRQGVTICFVATCAFILPLSMAIWGASSPFLLITSTILCMMILLFGRTIAISTTLSLALENYQKTLGTASALFGFFYYGLMSLVTFGMGMLHNQTLIPMPLYFIVLGCAVFGIFQWERASQKKKNAEKALEEQLLPEPKWRETEKKAYRNPSPTLH